MHMHTSQKKKKKNRSKGKLQEKSLKHDDSDKRCIDTKVQTTEMLLGINQDTINNTYQMQHYFILTANSCKLQIPLHTRDMFPG